MKRMICCLGMFSILSMGTVNVSRAQEYETKVKRGWSKKAKGGVIGAGGGAVVGGLIGHGLGGAAVGAAVGGAGGYLWGRHKDKKNPYRPVKVKHKPID